MLKKILGRSAGGTAIAGLVLSAAPIAAAPQIAQMACPYPDGVATSTSMTLTRPIAGFGARSYAKIRVSSGAGTPSGEVDLVIDGRNRGTYTLNNGATNPRLPLLTSRRTHVVTAVFVESCEYKSSEATKYYTVTKAKTKTRPVFVNKRKAVFRATVKSYTPRTVTSGKVYFQIKRGRTVIRAKHGRVHSGVAFANMRNLPKGTYTLKVKYLGNRNFKISKTIRKFRV